VQIMALEKCRHRNVSPQMHVEERCDDVVLCSLIFIVVHEITHGPIVFERAPTVMFHSPVYLDSWVPRLPFVQIAVRLTHIRW